MNSDSVLQKRYPYDSPLYTSHFQEPIFSSHYRPYSEYQEIYDSYPLQHEIENITLDLYQIPLYNQTNLFSNSPQETEFFQNSNFNSEFTRTTQSTSCETEIQEQSNRFQNVGGNKQLNPNSLNPLRQNSNPIVNGFVNLVNQVSSFYIDKLSEKSSSISSKNVLEKGLKEITNNIENRRELNLKDSKSCIFSTETINQNKSVSKRMPKESLNGKENECIEDEELKTNSKITKKLIKKLPKKKEVRWEEKYNQNLLKFAKKYNYNWNKIANIFKNIDVTPIFLREKYNSLINQESMVKSEPSIELIKEMINQDFQIENEDLIYKFESLTNKIPSINEQNLSTENTKTNDALLHKTQEEILDSYFNTDITKDFESPIFQKHLSSTSKSFNSSSEETFETFGGYGFPRKVEEDILEGETWEDKPPKEAIEILNGRISLLTSLYNQTRIELDKLQREVRE